MACKKREETGNCGHSQCPMPHKTEHGYECVEIIGGFCEVGADCVPECHHSWRASDKKTEAKVNRIFEEYCARIT